MGIKNIPHCKKKNKTKNPIYVLIVFFFFLVHFFHCRSFPGTHFHLAFDWWPLAFLILSPPFFILSYSPWKEQLKGRKKLLVKLSVAFWTIAWSAAILRQTGEQRRTKWSKVWPLIMSTAGQTNYCRSFTWKEKVDPTNLKRDINIDAAGWIWKTSGRGLVTCRVNFWLKRF